MSVPFFYLKCSNCKHRFINLNIPIRISYVLENDINIELGRNHVWCSDCKDITNGENLPTIKELEQSITEIEKELDEMNANLKSLESEYNKRRFFKSKKLEERIRYVEYDILRKKEYLTEELQVIKWISQRISAPRCLSCGSTNIIQLEYIEINENYFKLINIQHNCGGSINKLCDPDLMLFYGLETLTVDSEGRLIN